MGLDMYLYEAKTFYKPYQDEKSQHGKLRKLAVGIGLHPSDDDTIQMIEVKVQCGYWRKANHIHQWFVEKCQGGVDECQEAYVSPERLEELHAACKMVVISPELAAVGAEHLPTQPGFFFGSTEYDEYYKSDCEDTMAQIDALRRPDGTFDPESTFYYRSSW